MISPKELAHVADLVRTAAADELQTRFRAVAAAKKADGSLITEADLAMQRRLHRQLAEYLPRYALLGEEMSAAEQQAMLDSTGEGVWCLDPLDGTANFAAGIPFFAVSLALLVEGRTCAAVVYDPVRKECFRALRGHGVWLNSRRLTRPASPTELRDCMAMVDLKRLPAALVIALGGAPPYRSQRSFGSVALDWCWVASGRCQLYLHGGQRLWDYAAGRLILEESGAVGGVLQAYDGDWQDEPTLEPRIAIAATDTRLLDQWRGWISAALAGA